MKVYSVSYDLRKPGQAYSSLIAELKNSPGWWHNLQSTWLIATPESADELWRRLAPYLDQTDFILVIEVTANYQGWLPKKAWEWIYSQVGMVTSA
jgi:hypothetical protein